MKPVFLCLVWRSSVIGWRKIRIWSETNEKRKKRKLIFRLQKQKLRHEENRRYGFACNAGDNNWVDHDSG